MYLLLVHMAGMPVGDTDGSTCSQVMLSMYFLFLAYFIHIILKILHN